MSRMVLMLLFLLFFSALSFGQTSPVKKIEKPAAGVPLLDFDKETQLMLTLNTKQSVTFVSYVKLKGKKSFLETIRWEVAHDAKRRKKFPNNYNEYVDAAGNFVPSTGKAPIKDGQSRFHQIPFENLNYNAEAKTLDVKFGAHTFYNPDSAKKDYTYVNVKSTSLKDVKKKVICEYVEKRYDYLEPNSRYALIVGFSTQENVAAIFQKIHKGDNTAANTAINEIADKQIKLMKELRFIPDLQTFTSFYTSQLKASYDTIDTKEASITTRNGLGTTGVIATTLSNNVIFQSVLDQLKREQSNNYGTTGPTRDSLIQLFNTVSNLFTSPSSVYQRIYSGAIPLDFQFQNADATKAQDRAANVTRSIERIMRLQLFLSNYRVIATGQFSAASLGSLQTVIDKVNDLRNVLNDNLADLTSILEQRTEIDNKIKINESFSDVVITDASSYVQDFETRGRLSITPDFGVITYGLFPWNTNKDYRTINTYVGFHINWRPLDKNLHFKSIPNKKWYSLHHWSTMIGMTLIADKSEGKRDNFFGKNNLLIGGGYRVGSFLRIVVGTMLFKKYDENIVGTEKKTTSTMYVGLSLDVDLKKFVNGIADVFASK